MDTIQDEERGELRGLSARRVRHVYKEQHLKQRFNQALYAPQQPVSAFGFHNFQDDQVSFLSRLLYIVIGAIVVYFSYFMINGFNTSGGHIAFSPQLPVDALIPLIPIFSVPYLAFQIVPLLVGFYLRTYSAWKAFWFSFYPAGFLAAAFWLAFPTKMERPDISQLTDPWLMHAIYDGDSPYTIFPSLHAFVAVYAALFFTVKAPGMAKLLAVPSLILAASTVLVKQHYLLDVVSGAALGAAAFAGFLLLSRFAFYKRSLEGYRRPMTASA